MGGPMWQLFCGGQAFRMAQILRAGRGAATIKRRGSTSEGVSAMARNITGQNKRRFVDVENGIDIDLTYINSEVRRVVSRCDAR